MVTEVWIVESGQYSDWSIDLVAADVATAVEKIKETYKHPYIVVWSDLKKNSESEYILVGDFAAVPGYSTKHLDCFCITRHEVVLPI